MSYPKWQKFERLVAAINMAADRDADVNWNNKIDGRQFDVTINYTKGLYDFLIVIECKDYSSPLPIEKVEAFATKSKDVNANRAILASSSGFQSGCLKVAKKNDILLYHIQHASELNLPNGVTAEGQTLVNQIVDIEFQFKNGESWVVPKFQNEVDYYLKKARINGGPANEFLNKIVRLKLKNEVLSREPRRFEFELESFVKLTNENDSEIPRGEISKVLFSALEADATILKSETIYDPSVILPAVHAHDVLNDKTHAFNLLTLPFRLRDELEVGGFYENPVTGARYALKGINDNLLTIFLVESFQHGMLIQAEFIQNSEYFDYAERISDQQKIARLKRRMQKIDAINH